MTLTAPGCGMGEVLAADVRDKVQAVPTVAKATWKWSSIRPGLRR